MGEEALQSQQLQQEEEVSKPAARPKVSCVPKADALWFCYCESPSCFSISRHKHRISWVVEI